MASRGLRECGASRGSGVWPAGLGLGWARLGLDLGLSLGAGALASRLEDLRIFGLGRCEPFSTPYFSTSYFH